MPVPANIVDDFKTNALNLIAEAAAYVAAGVHDAETEASIRQLRIVTQALSGALLNTNMVSTPIIPPPTA